MIKTKELSSLAMLLSIAIVLHIVEGMIPLLQIFILPGVKLGLANIVTLLTLVCFDFQKSVLVVCLRILLSSLFIGTFLTFPFYLSLAGALFSSFFMGITYIITKEKVNIITISIIGSLAHNIAQLLTTAILMKQAAIFIYLPYMLLFSLPTGLFIGLIVDYIIKRSNIITISYSH